MHTLNTLTISPTAVTVQRNRKWKGIKIKKNYVRTRRCRSTKWKSLNIVLHWGKSEAFENSLLPFKGNSLSTFEFRFDTFSLSIYFSLLYHHKISLSFELWYFPFWSMLIYTITCCLHSSAFISFFVLCMFFYCWLIRHLYLYDDLIEINGGKREIVWK